MFRLFIFAILVSIILTIIGNHFEAISSQNQSLTYAKQALNTFYSDARDVDMIFLGSSHSYCTFDPEYFDEHMRIYSYQLGTPMQHPDTGYFMLREVLYGENPKKPKKVVLELYWDMIDDPFELKQADMFLGAIRNKSLKKEYIKTVFPLNEKIKYTFKPVRYQQDAFAYYNKSITDFVDEHKLPDNKDEIVQDYKEYYKDRGFLYTDKIMPDEKLYSKNQFRNMNLKNWHIDKKQEKYIKSIARLCDMNGIKLYFVTAPIANTSMKYISKEDYSNIHDTISNLADELKVPYIDYNIVNQDKRLLSNNNFCDDAHLNYSGAVIVQQNFIDWLNSIDSTGGN